MGLADFFDEAKRDLIDDISSLLNPREPDSGDDNGDAATIVQVVTQTAPKTFTGNAVLVTQTAGGAVAGGAVFASRTDEAATTQALETAAPTSAATSAAATTAIIQPTQAVTTPLTTPLTTPVYNTPFGAAVTSSLNSAQATNQSKQAANSGLSGGAKAGIAFGVLIPVAALLIGALILIRRKKQQKDAGEKLDDEKAGYAKQADALPSFPAPAPAPAPALAPAQSQTPSVTEVATQFDPRMSKLASPNGATAAGAGAGALTAAAAVGAAGGKRSPSPQSAWERPGAEKNSNDPANPFGDHAINNNAQPAPAPQPRASSPINIDAADFPLPGSVAPSERAISLVPDPSSDNLSLAPSNPATASNLSLIAPGTPTSSLGMAAAAGVAGAAAAGAANNRNSPPPADNVYRVQLDFEPSMEDELGIRAGQLVRILHAYDDGWALCMRMDRSQQGVVPRTCLSKNSVKPRQGPPPQGRPAFGQPGRPMTPQGGRNSPAPYAQPGRPMTPQGRPMTPQGRPMTPQGRPMTPQGRPMTPQGRPMTPQGGPMMPAGPQGRARAQSNAGPAPYAAYAPQGRSMSPGPYGPPGQMAPPSRPDAASRIRSNSMGNMGSMPPVKPLSPTNGTPNVARKPVPGQAV